MLLDTSGLFCLLHRDEPQHRTAHKFYSAGLTRLTHGYVLDELVSLATARRISRPASLKFSQQLLDDANIEVVWINEIFTVQL